MECEEAQKDEVEALQSIYMDEFMMLNDSPVTYELIVLADTADANEEAAIRARLRVEYPAAYPKESPQITPHVEAPLTIRDLEHIKLLIEDTCRSQLGSPLVYDLCEKIRDFLIVRKTESQSEEQEETKAKDVQKKAENDKLMHPTVRVTHEVTTFTPVTNETYAKWRAKYDKGLADAARLPTKTAADRRAVDLAEEVAKRPSGRVIFEQRRLQMQKKGAEKAEDSKAPDAKTELFYYNEDVFEDVGDVDDVDLD